MTEQLTQQWLNAMLTDIRRVLSNFITDEKLLERYVTDPENAAVWVRSMRERTVSMTNNEVLEYIGDRRFNAALMKYIIEKYPGWDENTYTQMDNRYKSKFFHHQVMLELGLLQHYRTLEDQTGKLKRSSDLLESFVGALGVIGDRMEPRVHGVKVGGDVRITQFVEYIFKDRVLDPERESLQPPKIFLGQLFDRIGLPLQKTVKDRRSEHRITVGEGGMRREDSPGKIQFNFVIRAAQIAFFNGILSSKPDLRFVPGRDGTLVIGEGITTDPESEYSTKVAEMTAWQKAADELINRGFTEQWIELWDRKQMRDSPELRHLILQAEAIAKNRDPSIVEIYLYHGAKIEKPKLLIQIIAILNDGREKSIFQYLIDDQTRKDRPGNRDALLAYINKHQNVDSPSAQTSEFVNSTFTSGPTETVVENRGFRTGRARSRFVPDSSESASPSETSGTVPTKSRRSRVQEPEQVNRRRSQSRGAPPEETPVESTASGGRTRRRSMKSEPESGEGPEVSEESKPVPQRRRSVRT
jgi:dsRNA-specific ribonuclease